MGTLYRFRLFCQGVGCAITLGAFCRFFRPRFALSLYYKRTYANFVQKKWQTSGVAVHDFFLSFSEIDLLSSVENCYYFVHGYTEFCGITQQNLYFRVVRRNSACSASKNKRPFSLQVYQQIVQIFEKGQFVPVQYNILGYAVCYS